MYSAARTAPPAPRKRTVVYGVNCAPRMRRLDAALKLLPRSGRKREISNSELVTVMVKAAEPDASSRPRGACNTRPLRIGQEEPRMQRASQRLVAERLVVRQCAPA